MSGIRDQKPDPVNPTSPANPRLWRLAMTVEELGLRGFAMTEHPENLTSDPCFLSSDPHPPPTSPRTPAARRGRERKGDLFFPKYTQGGERRRSSPAYPLGHRGRKEISPPPPSRGGDPFHFSPCFSGGRVRGGCDSEDRGQKTDGEGATRSELRG